MKESKYDVEQNQVFRMTLLIILGILAFLTIIGVFWGRDSIGYILISVGVMSALALLAWVMKG